LSTQRARNEGWVLTPRHRAVRTVRSRADSLHATKTVCPTEPLKNGGFPIRDAFRLQGALSGPRPIPVHRERAGPASNVPSSVARYRFGLVRPVPLPAATESVHAEPTPPTDFCNRQRAWAHRVNDRSSHRTRSFGAFCWFGICLPNLRAARLPELALRTPEGKTAPACRTRSQHARRSRSGRLAKNLLSAPRRSPAHRQQDLVDLR
jgi:hypothetical protein